jgi:hypothetical protein
MISRNDAAAALQDVERATGRSRQLRGYRAAGPILMVWGLIWILGYGAMGSLSPQYWGQVWLVLNGVGAIATVLMMRNARDGVEGSRGDWRAGVAAVAGAVFVASTFIVFQPQTIEPFIAFPGLVVGVLYVVIGILLMPRMAVIGLLISAATMIGFFAFQPWLAFWMAAVGGGGLLLGGLWMRSA